MYTLRFTLTDVHRLAEHAASSSEHTPSYAQLIDGIRNGTPALEWVHDDGIYLLVEPLPPGDHTLHFTAAHPSGFELDVTYRLHIGP